MKLKSLSEFKKTNSSAILNENAKTMVFGGIATDCGSENCADSFEYDHTATDNKDTCNTTWNENNQMIAHTHTLSDGSTVSKPIS